MAIAFNGHCRHQRGKREKITQAVSKKTRVFRIDFLKMTLYGVSKIRLPVYMLSFLGKPPPEVLFCYIIFLIAKAIPGEITY